MNKNILYIINMSFSTIVFLTIMLQIYKWWITVSANG